MNQPKIRHASMTDFGDTIAGCRWRNNLLMTRRLFRLVLLSPTSPLHLPSMQNHLIHPPYILNSHIVAFVRIPIAPRVYHILAPLLK